ncbi:MAG: transglutaminase domain-containing protein [Candidatus Neomarinimicrobiota bacterium]
MSCAKPGDDYHTLIDRGEFTAAASAIRNRLSAMPTPGERLQLEFELERLNRIRQDFQGMEEEVREYVRQYIPQATAADFARWEASRALESRLIDGEKRYFNRAGRNLFRIDPEARKIWEKLHPEDDAAGSGVAKGIDSHNAEIIASITGGESGFVKPVRLKITQSIAVNADAVPEGETVRCWIPFPREIAGRQDDIKLSVTEPRQYILAPGDQLQRTIYLEKPARAGEQTKFSVSYEYTSRGAWMAIVPEQVTAVARDDLQPYLQERPPHIVFTPALRAISQEVLGGETNPYRIAQKLFKWVDDNIPWASAREYSTIRNIPQYAVDNRHGDCGIQTLTFMTLCRLNGIPTRWQSGWEFKPPDDSMHDWGMIYFEPYGWLPMDVTYGIRAVSDERGRWFYLGGMDSYRTIFNDDYSQPFYPAKIHPRSETIDSQRGEVEWRGGNLYFDQWDWSHEWVIIQ